MALVSVKAAIVAFVIVDFLILASVMIIFDDAKFVIVA